MNVSSTIERKLRERFQPVQLDVVDESENHRGHGGWREGGQTHFRVSITAGAFDGMTRLARQRMVYAALKDELEGSVHALSLEVKGEKE